MTIIESSGDVVVGFSFGKIMLAGGHDSVVGLGVERSRCRHLDIEFLEREVLA